MHLKEVVPTAQGSQLPHHLLLPSSLFQPGAGIDLAADPLQLCFGPWQRPAVLLKTCQHLIKSAVRTGKVYIWHCPMEDAWWSTINLKGRSLDCRLFGHAKYKEGSAFEAKLLWRIFLKQAQSL